MLWRQWREQSRRLVWMPVGFALVLGAITVLAFSVPGVLTPLTRRALDTAMTLYFHRIHGAVALGLAFLVFQSPYFIALFASLTGSQIAQASIGGEWVRGGFELLLSAPYRPQVLYVAFLVSDLLLTIWGFVWLAAVSLGVSLGVLVAMGVHLVSLPRQYFVMALVLPLPIALFANLIALTLTFMFPKLAQIRAGGTANVIQTLAILPAVLLIFVVTLHPAIHPMRVAEYAIAAGIIGALGLVTLLRRWFNVETLLET
ncbi:hypothetical protein TPY_1457 [Sulfobacillus acidophilus TPY]|nr:hypothetical protein TPY_1457 [Sulfobacillus acidophilus TPY]